MILQEDLIIIGRASKPHGIRGEVAVKFSPDAFDMEGKFVFFIIDGIAVPFLVEEERFKGDSSLLKLKGLESEKQAAILTNLPVMIERDRIVEYIAEGFDAEDVLAELEAGHEYGHLVGVEVIDAGSGKIIGKINDVDDSTENILYQVISIDGNEEYLIPAAEEMVVDFDEENKKLIINIPEGLLDLWKE